MGKIEDQIPVDLKTAMFAKDKVKLAALRAVKSAFLLEKTSEPGKFIPARTDNVNVHVMNKYSIVRQSKKIVEMYCE